MEVWRYGGTARRHPHSHTSTPPYVPLPHPHTPTPPTPLSVPPPNLIAHRVRHQHHCHEHEHVRADLRPLEIVDVRNQALAQPARSDDAKDSRGTDVQLPGVE